MYTLDPSHRYAVVSPMGEGPWVSFWQTHLNVIELLSRHCHASCGKNISVWHRKSPKARWVCISA